MPRSELLTAVLVAGNFYAPRVADGYSVHLHPLHAGRHRLSFNATLADRPWPTCRTDCA
jgi:hypothetical protein